MSNQVSPDSAEDPVPLPAALPDRAPSDRRVQVRTAVIVVVGVSAALIAGAALLFAQTEHSPNGRTYDALNGKAMAEFYLQKPQWGVCAEFAAAGTEKQLYSNPKLDCAYVDVPLDYTQPTGKTAKIALLRQKAGDRAQRIGSLLINPGGPGASGIEWTAGLVNSVPDMVSQRFDLIGFDPRGIGASKPLVQCFTPAERDADRLDLSSLDNSPTGVAHQEDRKKAYASECEKRTGADLLANIGTRDVVKDMDIIRAALGDSKLTLLAYSYGTRLGYTYAETFPQNVRALVLDGAVDPNQTPLDLGVVQAEAFQSNFNAFAASCATQRQCPIGQDPAGAVSAFRALVTPLETMAVPVPDGRRLSYNDAMTGVTQALYSAKLWYVLKAGLAELKTGRGRILMALADIYLGRKSDGSYSSIQDAYTAITCVDSRPVTDSVAIAEADKRARQVGPFEDDGHGPDPARDVCVFWPVPYTSEPHPPKVPGMSQVLVISGTDDPATPYQAGVNLANSLSARLLTAEDHQHTATFQGNHCVNDYVSRYLIDPSALPPEGARCTVADN